MSAKKDPAAVETTLDDLHSVDTNPILKAVSATLTLDEEPVSLPSATQLLTPIDEAPTDLRRPAVKSLGVSAAVTQRRRKSPMKSDGFESSPSLAPAAKDAAAPRGPPPAWRKTAVWTPGLLALSFAGVMMLLVVLFVLLRA